MKLIKYGMGKSLFGVCSFLAELFGISTRSVRLNFVYASCLTLGSPIFFYLVIAFWLNIKQNMVEKRTRVWDL